MAEHVFALLIHDGVEHFATLRKMLCELSVETCTVSTGQEATKLISRRRPDVIFTECAMRDGSWADVLNLARKAGALLSMLEFVVKSAAHRDCRRPRQPLSHAAANWGEHGVGTSFIFPTNDTRYAITAKRKEGQMTFDPQFDLFRHDDKGVLWQASFAELGDAKRRAQKMADEGGLWVFRFWPRDCLRGSTSVPLPWQTVGHAAGHSLLLTAISDPTSEVTAVKATANCLR
jgi:CheY-like chemotaxis protein